MCFRYLKKGGPGQDKYPSRFSDSKFSTSFRVTSFKEESQNEVPDFTENVSGTPHLVLPGTTLSLWRTPLSIM